MGKKTDVDTRALSLAYALRGLAASLEWHAEHRTPPGEDGAAFRITNERRVLWEDEFLSSTRIGRPVIEIAGERAVEILSVLNEINEYLSSGRFAAECEAMSDNLEVACEAPYDAIQQAYSRCDHKLHVLASQLMADWQIQHKRADSKTDNEKKSSPTIPENPRVSELAREINARRESGDTMMSIALEITEQDEQEAKTLLRQLRRFRHLLV
jgi:hypothetical protein